MSTGSFMVKVKTENQFLIYPLEYFDLSMFYLYKYHRQARWFTNSSNVCQCYNIICGFYYKRRICYAIDSKIRMIITNNDIISYTFNNWFINITLYGVKISKRLNSVMTCIFKAETLVE